MFWAFNMVLNYFADYFLPSLVQIQPNLHTPPTDKVVIIGDGSTKAVSVRPKDVTSFTINAVDDPRTLNKAVYLRPTGNACSMNELVEMWELKIGKRLDRAYMMEVQILDKMREKMEMGFNQGGYSIAAAAFLGLLMVVLLWRSLLHRRKTSNFPPAVPGLPLLGNLHQLKAKKPHQTFAKWGETYGPIYSIRTGASTLVVLNSTDLAKEAMVTKFSSISTRKLSNALKILTADKSMVAMSDYGDFHRTVKRCILTSILGPNAQRRRRHLREAILDNVLNHLHTYVKNAPNEVIKFRETFQDELFSLAMKQAIGFDVESIYVDDFGAKISKEEIYNILVLDPMMGAIEVDWRDFFPYLRWIPNKKFEMKIDNMAKRRAAVTKALIAERKKQAGQGENDGCYLDFLLSEAKMLSEDELTMLVWEAIIETSDTTVVTTEWALFELAKFPAYQERLYKEICDVCGSEKLTEDHLPKLPYLSAVFHETLRKHSPVPIIPLRYVHEDTQLGGYHIPVGTEIAVNIYGCNMDKKEWDNPEEWNPGRFMGKGNETTDLHRTMAFGGGKRTCAGALQAMLISCSTIGRLVQEFHWRLKEGEEENEVTVQLTNYKLHPMQAILTPRNVAI